MHKAIEEVKQEPGLQSLARATRTPASRSRRAFASSATARRRAELEYPSLPIASW